MKITFVIFRSFLLSLICVIGFVLIAMLIGDQRIDHFDHTIIAKIQGVESAGLTSIMKLFTFVGSGTALAVIAAIMLGILAMLHYRVELLFFVGVICGSTLLNMVLKTFFHRGRPTLHRIIEVNGYSFPSGHSMAAFTFYGIATFLLWKHMKNVNVRMIVIAIGLLMILGIGISRIYLGVHYPSDIVGGYLASGTWLAAMIGMYQYFLERRSYKRRLRQL